MTPFTPLESGGRYRDALKGVITDPVNFFKAVPQGGPLKRVLLFAIGCHAVGIAVMMVCMAFFFTFIFGMITHLDRHAGRDAPPLWRFPLLFGGMAVFSPVFAAINILLYAALDHLALVLLGGGGGGFETTLRAVCYAQGPLALGVVPLIGMQIGQIWSLVLRVIALKEMHSITLGKAIAAVVLPIVTLFCLIFGLYFFMIFVVMGAASMHN
jgi:hypothetical protein